MLIQTLIVAALVLACAVYASWTLMPSGLRRRLAQHLLQLRWPSAVAQRLRRDHLTPLGPLCGTTRARQSPPPLLP